VLPSFEKVRDGGGSGSDVDSGSGQPDAGRRPGGCGPSAELPRSCDDCIREHCCDLAEACGEDAACAEDMLEPITPAADFGAAFDPLLACMQRECDRECEVSWGCTGEYEWPTSESELDFQVKVIDFAAVPDAPLEGVRVQACQGIDPACESGQVDEAVTDAEGLVRLQVQPNFDGFFAFEGADYLPSTVQWSEPIFRKTDFTHYALSPSALTALALITGVHQSAEEMFDPEVGHLIFRVQGCLPMRYLNNPMAPPQAEVADVHIRFEPDDGATQVFYTDENSSVSLTLEATSKDGVGGAFNVPARNVTVHAVDALDDREVARGSVRIRPGALGYVYLVARSRE
jgi:hypothetical protein